MESTILVKTFWKFTMFQYRSNSPQVKRNLISSITNLVCELPHELQSNLKIGSGKYQTKFRWREQVPPQKLNFANSREKLCKSRYHIYLVAFSFTGFLYKYFVQNRRIYQTSYPFYVCRLWLRPALIMHLHIQFRDEPEFRTQR